MRSAFFNGDEEYGQDDFSRYFDNIYKSGVSIDENGDMTFAVSHRNGIIVVSPGFAIIKGFSAYEDAETELEIEPDENLTRVDRVVLRVNLLKGPVEIIVKTGTASSSPTAPELTRDSDTYELSLAKVTVTTDGTLSIQDERYDKSVCGAIRPKNLTEYNAMIAEFQRQWELWFANQQSGGWRDIYIQSERPEGMVAGSIWIKIKQ